jgi:acyl carrier protein
MEEKLRMEKMVQSDSEIAEKFAQIVADSLRIDPSRVTLDAYLDDLGAESLDLIEITMESEAAFNIWIPEKSILQTAIEVCGPGVLEQDGYLTEEGRRLMAHRLPQAEANALPQRLSIQDLRRYFVQVATWVRMVSELMKHTPEACTSCGGLLKAAPGLRLKCAVCAEEVRLRSGEELNREWVLNYYSSSLISEAAGADVKSKSACVG